MGWFYGFKLHIVCNEMGEIVNFMFTPGNVDDREPLKVAHFTEELYGKLVGDRGYISKDLFCKLFIDGIQLITKLKNKMENPGGGDHVTRVRLTPWPFLGLTIDN